MTVESVTIDLIETFFKRYKIKYSRHETASKWLLRYYNFRLKFIPSSPRQVFMSTQLRAKLPFHPSSQEVLQLAHEILLGRDINPHQGKESFNSDYHDGLFNDWGIHHLHLSSKKRNKNDYFLIRSGPLLFARFTNDAGYLLDIQDHNAKDVWSNTDFIRIMQQNWPDLIADREVPGVKWSPDLNDRDIKILRDKGYLYGVNVDGKAYMFIGHGQSSSGDNMMASRLAGEVWRWVGDNRPLFESDTNLFKLKLKEQLRM